MVWPEDENAYRVGSRPSGSASSPNATSPPSTAWAASAGPEIELTGPRAAAVSGGTATPFASELLEQPDSSRAALVTTTIDPSAAVRNVIIKNSSTVRLLRSTPI